MKGYMRNLLFSHVDGWGNSCKAEDITDVWGPNKKGDLLAKDKMSHFHNGYFFEENGINYFLSRWELSTSEEESLKKDILFYRIKPFKTTNFKINPTYIRKDI